jgi:hypothetical protein
MPESLGKQTLEGEGWVKVSARYRGRLLRQYVGRESYYFLPGHEKELEKELKKRGKPVLLTTDSEKHVEQRIISGLRALLETSSLDMELKKFALQHIYTGYSELRKYCEKMVKLNGAKGPIARALLIASLRYKSSPAPKKFP